MQRGQTIDRSDSNTSALGWDFGKPMFEAWFTATAFQSLGETPKTPWTLTAELASEMFRPTKVDNKTAARMGISSDVDIIELVKAWPSVLYQDYMGDTMWNAGKPPLRGMEPSRLAIAISLLRASLPRGRDYQPGDMALVSLKRKEVEAGYMQLCASTDKNKWGSQEEELGKLGYCPSNWMKRVSAINSNMPLRALLIPGVHDAGCYHSADAEYPTRFPGHWPNWQCQSTSTHYQLELGARVIDWRIGLRPAKSAKPQDAFWAISHDPGMSMLTGWFRSFYAELRELLTSCNQEKNSGEVVIVRLKKQHAGSDKAFEELLIDLFSDYELKDVNVPPHHAGVKLGQEALARLELQRVKTSGRLVTGALIRHESAWTEGVEHPVRALGDIRLNELKREGGCMLILSSYRAKFSDEGAVTLLRNGLLLRKPNMFGRFSGSGLPDQVVAGQIEKLRFWMDSYSEYKPPPLKRS